MLTPLPFRAGLIKDDEAYSAKGYATDTNLIRWVRGMPEALGGWQEKTGRAQGIPRATHEWVTNLGVPMMGVGTTSKLYVHVGSRLVDITPMRSSGAFGNNPVATTNGSTRVVLTKTAHGGQVGDTVWISGLSAVAAIQIGGLAVANFGTNPFATVIGSAQVTVTHTAHGLSDNDIVTLASAAAVGGIPAGDLNTTHRVRVLTSSTYQIQAATAATSTATGGGSATDVTIYKPYLLTEVPSVDSFAIEVPLPANATTTGGGAGGLFQFDIAAGADVARLTVGGYGSGLYGAGPYGHSTTTVIDTPQPARLWSMDNWGEQLIANIVGGAIYVWRCNLSQRAIPLENAPAQCLAVAVTPERILLACGCTNEDGEFDPLLVRHTTEELNTEWVATATNSAGDFQLGTGSRVVGVAKRETGPIIFTDVAFYGVRWIGSLDQIYKADQLGVGCGLLAPNAVAQRDNDLYWVTPAYQFYAYRGGRPVPIECPLRQWFEARVNMSQSDKIFAYADNSFDAVTFQFQPLGSSDVTEYVRLDMPEQRRDPIAGWSHGYLPRTAWCAGLRFPEKKPLGLSADGFIFLHETGYAALGVDQPRLVEWAPVDLASGSQRVGSNRIVIDMTLSEDMTVILRAREYPKGAASTREITLTPATLKIDTQVAGRQLELTVRGRVGGASKWRVGAIRGELYDKGRK